jgi:hypothetical protein
MTHEFSNILWNYYELLRSMYQKITCRPVLIFEWK